MKLYFLTAIASASLGLLLSCGGAGKTEPATETAVAADEHEENTTSLTAAQLKSVGIELGSIEEKQLTASLKANGVLRVPNQNKATVNSIYSGVVKSLFAQPGNFVRKGQTLATISNPDFIQVQSEYLRTVSRISLVELEVKRQQDLNAGNAGALKNLQAAETELNTLRTARSTCEQQIRLMGINPAVIKNGKLISVLAITSPINGVISKVNVQMGSYVNISTAVAEIVDNSQLHVDLFVYEKDMSKLKNNQLIHFTVTNNPGKEYDAEIYSLGSSFEDQSKAVSVHAKVKGDKTWLIDGMNITALISLNKATVPAVQNEAIVTVAGQDFIFVVKDDHADEKPGAGTAEHDHGGETVFEKIPVVKGTSDIGFTEITLLKEIPKNSKIVTKGAFFVLAKMNNTGGHEH